MRIDLHVHSRFSQRPSAWFLKKIGCPESFTEPLQIYRTARQRGMDLVTITDHNRIAGALEIAHLPGTFVGEEVTTYFPEDRCKVHVLALGIDEAQHEDIQKARENIFDLVAYLRTEEIFHVLAHPLYPVNDRLTLANFERLILLFKNMELNGARNDETNLCLAQVLGGLTEAKIAELADRHGIEPDMPEPWRKCLTGGSDDHSSLNIARTYTEVPGEPSLARLCAGIAADRARVVRRAPTPKTMAHNLYGIAYQFYRSKFQLERVAGDDDLLRFLDASLREDDTPRPRRLVSRLYYFMQHRRRSRAATRMSDTLIGLLGQETRRLLKASPELRRITAAGVENDREPEETWFDFANQATNRVLRGFADHIERHLSGARVFNVFQTIGSAGGLYTLLAPYFIAYSLYTRDRHFTEQVRSHFGAATPEAASGAVNLAHFTDTFYEVNGVARTLQQQVAVARSVRINYTMVTCDAQDHPARPGVVNFKPVGIYRLPEYPEQKLFLPPLLEMLDYCYTHRVTQIHVATPGPVGLAALAIAHMLKLPISGTYHTQIPQYARFLTGDQVIQDLAWKYTLWYYEQMECVYAPSESTRRELIDRGLAPEKVQCYPRGIDTRRFHPSKRNGYLKRRFGVEAPVKLLYVGRISREKNLPLLVEAFARLAGRRTDVHLVVVGDGPYLPEMRRRTAGLPCTYTGYLGGEDLADAYAACDLFVFPSATDTFGNVVLEAQASGLPVIVTDRGGPAENVHHGRDGLVVPADDAEALLAGMQRLVQDPALRQRMGAAGRGQVEKRSFDAAFQETWKMFERLDEAHHARFAQTG